MMSASSDSEEDSWEDSGGFSVHDISFEKRDGLAVGYQVCVDFGLKKKEIRKAFAARGYPISDRTWRKWSADLRDKGYTFLGEKKSGAKPLLTHQQVRFFVGWVLHQNSQNVPVSLEDGRNCIRSNFGITVSVGTQHNLFVTNGFSSQLMQHRTAGYKLNNDERAKKVVDFITTCRRNNIFPSDRSFMCAIDCTLTGHRTDKVTTYAPRNSGQQRLGAPLTTFTNLIITVLWADGRQWTLCMLFTFNKKFQLIREGKRKRKKWDEEVTHFQQELHSSRICADRVVYIGSGNNDSRTYVSEVEYLPSCLHTYFEYWENIRDSLKDCVVFSDNGHGFFEGRGEDKKSILERICFGRHECFPADVHEVLNPCDNRLHGQKKIWKAEMKGDFSDDVASCLRLMDIFDQVPREDVIGWWNTNLQLDVQEVTLERANKAISKRRSAWMDVHKECLREYRIAAGIDARGSVPEAPRNLDSGLDGVKWQ